MAKQSSPSEATLSFQMRALPHDRLPEAQHYGVTVKIIELVRPPPGAGFNTVTVRVPAVAISVAEILAVIRVEETNVVVRFDPAHCTTELVVKPVPLTVRVKAGWPAFRDVGLIEEIVGTALLIVKV